jgi:hypothetical protein
MGVWNADDADLPLSAELRFIRVIRVSFVYTQISYEITLAPLVSDFE